MGDKKKKCHNPKKEYTIQSKDTSFVLFKCCLKYFTEIFEHPGTSPSETLTHLFILSNQWVLSNA